MTDTQIPSPANAVLNINDAMLAWLSQGRAVAEAIVIEATGAAPVPVGGRMVIAAEDAFLGSVSGGCVEADVIASALDVIASGQGQLLTFGIADQVAWRSGLPCGSTIRVAVMPLEHSHGHLIYDAHRAVRTGRQPRIVATHLTTGERTVFAMGDKGMPGVTEALAAGTSRLVTHGGQTFLHVITPPPRIVIIGATHVAQILSVMASAAGYEAIVIDPRSAFTSETRFDAETTITGWPESEITRYANDPFSAIVTLTHVGHIDDEALKIAVRSPCRYAGALGSRKTHAARVARLQDAGYTDAEIARIHAPVGIDIGGRAPGEIAVSILAEIVAAFNGRLPV